MAKESRTQMNFYITPAVKRKIRIAALMRGESLGQWLERVAKPEVEKIALPREANDATKKPAIES